MYCDKRVCVIVPAFNEELLIERTITTVPSFVDTVLVVDDASEDRTADIVQRLARTNDRVVYVRHEKNRGVGAALSTGYSWCRAREFDIAVIMNGDNQMDPNDLPALLDPLVDDVADYTKGNRLVTGEAWKKIPHIRYLGNSVLTMLTKIASGYWHVTDSQSGYTAMNRRALDLLPIDFIYPGFGAPNDILVRLNIVNMRVKDVPVNPVYGIGEKSHIRIPKVIFSISLLLIRSFYRRMIQKYIIRDFHPLIFFYTLGFLVMLLDIPLIIRLYFRWKSTGLIMTINALAILLCTLSGLQLILFAMLFDMEANKDLKGEIYPRSH